VIGQPHFFWRIGALRKHGLATKHYDFPVIRDRRSGPDDVLKVAKPHARLSAQGGPAWPSVFLDQARRRTATPA
jgi:hypothetical protein